jgi:RecA-family ATPase
MQNNDIENLEFSYFQDAEKGIRNTKPQKTISFQSLVDYYFSEDLKGLTEAVTNAQNPEAKKEAKLKLPFITAHGTFSQRKDENIKKHNAFLITLDIDNLTDIEALAVKDTLAKNPSCLLCCLSPRKQGVKAFILSDESLTTSKRYKTLKTNVSLIAEKLNISEFEANIDLAQFVLCQPFFLAYDERIHINISAKPLHFGFKQPEEYKPTADSFATIPPPGAKNRIDKYLINAANNLINEYSRLQEGERHRNIVKVNILSKWMHYAPHIEQEIKSSLLGAVVGMYATKTEKESAKRSFLDAWTPDIVEANPNIEAIIEEIKQPTTLRDRAQTTTATAIKVDKPRAKTEYIKDEDEIEQEVHDAKKERKAFIPTWNNQPEEKEPLVYCGNTSILTHQNLSVIIASPGSGKSSLCESICACVLNGDIDALGFKVSATIGKVLYIDNERTDTDVWNSFKRMNQRAKLKQGENQDKVLIAGLRMVARLEDRKSEIEQLIQEHKPDLILLDGAGDLVNDTNSLEEAVNCRVWLRELTSKYKLSILTTLHPNKGTMNPRGHIGSEIIREAEGVIGVIPGANDTRTITTDFPHGKNRNNKKEDLAHYVWSNEVSMFVSADAPENKKVKALGLFESLTDQDINNMLSNAVQEPLTYTALLESITDYLKKKHPGLKRGLNAVKILLSELTDGQYLTKVKKGRIVMYSCSQTSLDELI